MSMIGVDFTCSSRAIAIEFILVIPTFFNHKFNRGIYLIDKMARLPQDKVLNREKTISFPLRG